MMIPSLKFSATRIYLCNQKLAVKQKSIFLFGDCLAYIQQRIYFWRNRHFLDDSDKFLIWRVLLIILTFLHIFFLNKTEIRSEHFDSLYDSYQEKYTKTGGFSSHSMIYITDQILYEIKCQIAYRNKHSQHTLMYYMSESNTK